MLKVEVVKGSRAKCRGCSGPIKEEVRFGITKDRRSIYYHLECVSRSEIESVKKATRGDFQQLSGFHQLTTSQQQSVLATFAVEDGVQEAEEEQDEENKELDGKKSTAEYKKKEKEEKKI